MTGDVTETVHHVGAPTALGADVFLAGETLGLPETEIRKLLSAKRIQGRLSQRMLGSARSVWHALPEGFFAPAPVLERAIWFSGAVFSAEALSRLVTGEARASVAGWMPPGAMAFALAERQSGAFRFQRATATERSVRTDGEAAATCWLDGTVPSDQARLALRWTPPCERRARPAPASTLAALFERAIDAASEAAA